MTDGNGTTDLGSVQGSHVVFAWSPNGYSLREREGEAPAVGTEFEDEGHLLVVTKIGPSPLPGDPRPCAFTSGRH
jgi:hypothetical protein